jgi:hypothetical protein
LTPADYTKSGFVYEAPKAEQPNVVPKVQPKETPKEPSKSWWEWFGPAQTKP